MVIKYQVSEKGERRNQKWRGILLGRLSNVTVRHQVTSNKPLTIKKIWEKERLVTEKTASSMLGVHNRCLLLGQDQIRTLNRHKINRTYVSTVDGRPMSQLLNTSHQPP